MSTKILYPSRVADLTIGQRSTHAQTGPRITSTPASLGWETGGQEGAVGKEGVGVIYPGGNSQINRPMCI